MYYFGPSSAVQVTAPTRSRGCISTTEAAPSRGARPADGAAAVVVAAPRRRAAGSAGAACVRVLANFAAARRGAPPARCAPTPPGVEQLPRGYASDRTRQGQGGALREAPNRSAADGPPGALCTLADGRRASRRRRSEGRLMVRK